MRLRNRSTRIVTTASAVVFLTAASLVTASGAESGKPAVTADPLATWQTNGIVWSLAYARGVVYVGGTFDHVRPPGAKPGEKEVARKNFAAFDAATGKLLPCAHSFTGGVGTVRAMKASRDGKVLYIGGSFGQVDKTGVTSAAAINTADCSLRRDFRPAMSAPVHAIETTDKEVYLGGAFTRVNGQIRKHLASFSPSGSLLPFSADIDQPVLALAHSAPHNKLLVGGAFDWVNGVRSHALVGLNPSTGSTVSTYFRWLPRGSSVKSIALGGTNFYVGAEGYGTGVFDGRIAGRLTDDSMVWKDTCLGATQAVVAHKDVLYSASHAHNCSQTPGGFPEHLNRQHFLAQSVHDSHILHWFPDTDGGLAEAVGPRALVMAKGYLWSGGEFTSVNDKPQQGLTRFGASKDTGAPEAAPRLTATDSGNGKVLLSWRAAWDRDDAVLTYRIYRDGKLVASPKQRSTSWDRPIMTYTDSVTPGSRHTYTIAVTDGDNASAKSAAIEVATAAAAPTAGVR
jgi:hypothetical protein